MVAVSSCRQDLLRATWLGSHYGVHTATEAHATRQLDFLLRASGQRTKNLQCSRDSKAADRLWDGALQKRTVSAVKVRLKLILQRVEPIEQLLVVGGAHFGLDRASRMPVGSKVTWIDCNG